MENLTKIIEFFKKHSEAYEAAKSEENEEKMDFLELRMIEIYTDFGFSDIIVDSDDFELEAKDLDESDLIQLEISLEKIIFDFEQMFPS